MKIVIVSDNSDRVEHLRSVLRGAGIEADLDHRSGGVDQICAAADQDTPDLLIIDGVCHESSDLATLELPSRRHPNLAFILIGGDPSKDFLVRAMQVGVRDVLAAPVVDEELLTAVRRVRDKLTSNVVPRGTARVAAFMPCKGGSGATFIAANIAYMLASECHKKTLLMDLDFAVGDASMLICDHPGTTTIADIARNVGRMDSAFLAASVVHVLPNLDVMEAPESLEQAMDVTPDNVATILKLVDTEYDYVIINIGRTVDGVVMRAFDRADLIFPVFQMTVPFIRDTRRLLNSLQSLGVEPARIHLILNRFETGGDIDLADAERTIGARPEIVIPNSFKTVSASVNEGVPVARMASQNVVTKKLRLLMEKFFEASPTVATGWLATFLGIA